MVKTNPSSKLSAYVVKAVIQIVSQRSTTYATGKMFEFIHSIIFQPLRLAMAQALHMERQSSIIEVPMNEAESTCMNLVWNAISISAVFLTFTGLVYCLWKIVNLSRRALEQRNYIK